MSYIKTTRGWRLLHKRHHEIARSWQAVGLSVEEKAARLNSNTYWVSERSYNYWQVMQRLYYGARHRAKKSSIPFDVTFLDFDIPEVCPLRGVAFKVGTGQHTEDSPTLDRKDPRRGYVKGNVWVISHKANRLKGQLTPNELRTFCENVLALDWITCTSDDEMEWQSRQAERRRKILEKHKPRWWALWGSARSVDKQGELDHDK